MIGIKAPRLAAPGLLGKRDRVDSERCTGDAGAMISAFTLAFGQLSDPPVRAIWLKSLGLALLVFVLLAAGLWWLADWALAFAGFEETQFGGTADELRSLLALVGALLAGILLWRIVALMVLQFFADEVVRAVEVRHYPVAAAAARTLGWREELAVALRGAARALGYNLLALPFALFLIVTGIGAPLLFFAVNAVLLGRELQDMVWLRHRPGPDTPAPLRRWERLALGGVTTALLAVPFANLAAPFLGAAAATHLIHRKDAKPDVI